MIVGKLRILRIQTRPRGGLGENITEENEGGENFLRTSNLNPETVFPTSALSFFLLNQMNLLCYHIYLKLRPGYNSKPSIYLLVGSRQDRPDQSIISFSINI